MRGFKAALWKELRLFRSGVGWITILLPLLVLLTFAAGGAGTMQGAYLEPFPIAIRDEDKTIMSGTLIKQLSNMELFSQVIRADGETDEHLLEQGCAAIITIPKDFFYTTYYMEYNPVSLHLNSDMALEAAVLRAMFTSVIGIVDADQSANRAVFDFCYGELTWEQTQDMWWEAADQVLSDALGRQGGFDAAVESGAFQNSMERGILSCVLSIICLFFALSVVKTLPDELHSGVLPRFLAVGGRWGAFVASKLITGMLVSLPAFILVLWGFRVERWPMALLLGELLFLSAFGIFAGLAAWLSDVDSVQLWGNMLLMVSLVLGGGLYGAEGLPLAVQFIGKLTLPHYCQAGLREIELGAAPVKLLATLLPAVCIGAAGWIAALGGFRRRAVPDVRGVVNKPIRIAGREQNAVTGRFSRLIAVGLHRTKAMPGGCGGLLCLLICTALCGFAANSALTANPQTLHIAIAMEGGGALAENLAERIEAQPGVSVDRVSLSDGRRLVASGRAEGLLVLGNEYDRALKSGERPRMSYESASTSASAQVAREIIAGQSIAQRAELRAILDAGERLGRELTEAETEELKAKIKAESENAPALYILTETKGGEAAQTDLFAPNQLGFAALIVMLTLFILSAWTARPDVRRVEERMFALPHGRMLSYGGDVLALSIIGIAVGVCALFPTGIPEWQTAAALFAYVLCVTAMSLAITRHGALSGRMNVLAPFLALITSLLGGCFGNIGILSPSLKALSLVTPQGLALSAQRGAAWAFAALIAASMLFFLLGAPYRTGKSARKRLRRGQRLIHRNIKD